MADIYSTELPEHIAKPLLRLVEIAEKHKRLTLQFGRPPFEHGCTILLGEDTETISATADDFLLGLKALGFLQITGIDSPIGIPESGTIFLTEKAYIWAHSKRRGRIGRLWDRAVYGGKQVAPLIVSIAAVILTLLQILQTAVDLLSP